MADWKQQVLWAGTNEHAVLTAIRDGTWRGWLSGYADPIAVAGSQDATFLTQQLGSLNEGTLKANRDRLNVSSYGNLAYLALNAPAPYAAQSERFLTALASS